MNVPTAISGVFKGLLRKGLLYECPEHGDIHACVQTRSGRYYEIVCDYA
jgi:hypothetical protein